jgi:hypothetical protein
MVCTFIWRLLWTLVIGYMMYSIIQVNKWDNQPDLSRISRKNSSWACKEALY